MAKNNTNINETDTVKECPMTDEDALMRYLELQEMISALQEESDLIKAQLKEATAKEADRKLTLNGHKLTIRTQTKTTISYPEVLKLHPRLAKKFGHTTTYDVFTIR